MQSHTRTIFKHIGQMTWFFTLASMVYSILLSRISKVKSLTIVIIFNTILQMHNIFFTTRKCNIGSNSSVAGGNAGGKPCYLPFLSITVSSCQGKSQGNGRKGQKLISIFLFYWHCYSRIRSSFETCANCNIFFQHENCLHWVPIIDCALIAGCGWYCVDSLLWADSGLIGWARFQLKFLRGRMLRKSWDKATISSSSTTVITWSAPRNELSNIWVHFQHSYLKLYSARAEQKQQRIVLHRVQLL